MAFVTDEMLVWPDWLPIPVRNEYAYQPTDTRTSSQMEIMGVRRQEYDSDETTIDCFVVLQTAELAFFEAFERHLLRQGSLWFKMPIYTSYGTQYHKVRYRERPKFGEIFCEGEAAGMRVQFALETNERKTLSEIEVDMVYKYGLPVMDFVAGRLQQILHVKMLRITNIPDYWLHN